jgi:hypothetical protein
MASIDGYGPTGWAHANLMAYIWGPCMNIAVQLAMYRYRVWWIVLHGITGTFAFIFTVATSITILANTGLISKKSAFIDEYSNLYLHYRIGIACLVIITIQFLLGLATLLMQFCQAKSLFIVNVKKLHTIFGYIIVILIKSNYYINVKINS